MRRFPAWTMFFAIATLSTVSEIAAQKAQEVPPPQPETSCVKCHGESELWEGDLRRLYVTAKDLAQDIHWQKGIQCHECHGGDATSSNFIEAHSLESGFHSFKSPAEIPESCGRCHSDVVYMRRYRPSPRTDQLTEYWTSGHGQRLKSAQDPKVATCVSCHGGHGIRAVKDLESRVYPTHVAETCSTCHSNAALMAGRQYHGRPLTHNQHELWRESVHGRALLDKGDLSAPTCNDCHGNHGAVPPEVDSVANACGTCHTKVGALFAETRMKHRFEETKLPGCATCHSHHLIRSPSDEMLGMTEGAVCVRCHETGQFGATTAGATVARTMRSGLEQLKRQISEAEQKLAQAERLGMEVRGPRFELRKALDALTNARSLVHGFSPAPMTGAIDGGLEVSTRVTEKAELALREHTARRVWLAVSLVPILIVVALLVLYIRTLPPAAR